MSARESSVPQSAASQIHALSGDIEMGCVNLQVLLDSIIKSLDGSADDFHATHDQINCFTTCAKKIVATVLENSLATAKIARGVQS